MLKNTIMTKTGLAGECDPQGKSEGGWTWWTQVDLGGGGEVEADLRCR